MSDSWRIKCPKCGNDYPSKYWFHNEETCLECFDKETLTDHDEPETIAGESSDKSVQPSEEASSSKIFVCYRREDSGHPAGRIYDRLVQRFGQQSVFKDIDSIPLGVDFREHIAGVVGSCEVLLVVIGSNWLMVKGSAGKRRIDSPRDHLRIEIESALRRNIPIIPILVEGASIPEEATLPESIRDLAYRNGLPVRADPDFHRDVDRLIAGVLEYLERSHDPEGTI